MEQVIAEPEDFTDENMEPVCVELEVQIMDFIERYEKLGAEELVEKRYQRFRRM